MTRMNFPLQRDTLPAVVLRKAGHTVCQHHAPFSPQWFREDALCFFLLLLSLAFVPLVVPQTIHAETIVSGEVSGVWDTDGSPYLVTDTLIVAEGDTLLIEPGVTVEFQDQDSTNQTPFIIYGVISAQGSLEDSISFLSGEYPFYGFLTPQNYSDASIYLEYCIIDRAFYPIDVHIIQGVTLQHCRILSSETVLNNHSTSNIIEYCTINSYDGTVPTVSLHQTVNSRIENNRGDLELNIVSGTVEPIMGNTIRSLLYFAPYVVLYDNTFSNQVNFTNTEVEVYNNIFSSTVSFNISSGNAYNNTFNVIYIYQDNNLYLYDNYIYSESNTNIILLDESDTVIFRNNIIRGNGNGVDMDDCSCVRFVNNTFEFGTRILRQDNSTNVVINHNIFTGDRVDCTGYVLFSGDEPDSLAYNCFYNLSANVSGIELNETNQEENPCFAGGNPFDYHLQANSPCIDAGDPNSPDDPDGTRADIGCYYYDQSIDNPPVQTIPEEIIAQTGQMLRIQITATDDNGPFSFTFPDLPEWLSEEDELDWVSDTTAVSGTVPEEEEDFSFTVIVEDGEGQTDSSIVFINVDHRTLLSGEISGVLHVENSPFYVVEDIIVPEGDSLIIEPGCELQFRCFQDEEQFIQFECNGTLIAEGTETDSIYFHDDQQDEWDEGWYGTQLYSTQDTTRLAYCVFENSKQGISIWPNVPITIKHSRFYHTPSYAIRCAPGSFMILDSSVIIQEDPSYYSVKVATANAIITNSTFIYNYALPYNYLVIPLYVNESSSVRLINCSFDGGFRTNIVSNSTAEIRGCTYRDMRHGVIVSTGSTAQITNCLFERIGRQEYGEAAISTWRLPTEIANNVFHNCRIGVQFYAPSNNDTIPVIYNNLFLDNNVGLFSEDEPSELPWTQYNCFFGNDTLTWQCDISDSNLFCNPIIEDTLTYYLYDNSCLIDAGNPDTRYNDIDSTWNDIGLWGGPYGLSYTYPLIVQEDISLLPSKFEIVSLYPNPFNSQQQLNFTLPKVGSVRLILYNILGQPVLQIDWNQLHPGFHSKSYDASSLASGIYFIHLQTGKEVRIRKVVLVK